ncbi:MAG: MFS transporter [Spirochaetaceae bacterium]|jgi:hypothetical protein|nr:MFS transporter [Spirochaetaceae bacterium]
MEKKVSQFPLLFIINLLFFLGFNSMNILPAYLDSLGTGKGLTALFTTTPPVVLVFLVLLQIIRRRSFHKMKILRLGFFCSIVAMIGMRLFTLNLQVFYGFFLLTGLTYAAGFTNLFSMMYDVVPPEKRRSSAALFGISGLMSSGLSSLLVQWFYHHLSPVSIFYLPAFFSCAAFVLTFFLRLEDFTLVEKRSFSFHHFIHNKEIPRLIFQVLIFGGAFGIFKSFLPLITKERLGDVDITRFYIMFTLVGAFYRLTFAKWMDRVKTGILLGSGYLLAASSILFLGMVHHLYQLYLIGAIYGLSHSMLFPTFSAEFVRAGAESRAAYNNIFLALFTLGISGFSSSLGFFGDWMGLQAIPIFMVFLIGLGFLSLFHPMEGFAISGKNSQE